MQGSKSHMTATTTPVKTMNLSKKTPHQPHLQIFNRSDEASCGSQISFHRFAYLPKDMRLKIWRASLQRERIIEISVNPAPKASNVVRDRLQDSCSLEGEEQPEVNTELTQQKATDHPRIAPKPQPQPAAKSVHTEIQATVGGRKILSKLLRVNCESRQEAYAFYRVHLPCRFTKKDRDGRLVNGTRHEHTMLLNPEHDFFFVRTHNNCSPFHMNYMAFLTYIKDTLDPRHVGVLDLAIDYHRLTCHDGLSGQLARLRDVTDEQRCFQSAPGGLRRYLGISGTASHSVLLFKRS